MEAKLLEEKLEKEKANEMKKEEVNEDEKGSENVPEVNEDQNEVEEFPSESIEKPTEIESFSTDDGISYTPGPIIVPVEEMPTLTDSLAVSPLPPIPQNIVEQERLEMVEINNDGTSGHLSHSIE